MSLVGVVVVVEEEMIMNDGTGIMKKCMPKVLVVYFPGEREEKIHLKQGPVLSN